MVLAVATSSHVRRQTAQLDHARNPPEVDIVTPSMDSWFKSGSTVLPVDVCVTEAGGAPMTLISKTKLDDVCVTDSVKSRIETKSDDVCVTDSDKSKIKTKSNDVCD